MFKNTGTFSSDLCFYLINIWHILWLKRGSRYACMHVLICVSMFICCKIKAGTSVYVLLWEQDYCEQIWVQQTMCQVMLKHLCILMGILSTFFS